MANGENRATIRASVDKTSESIGKGITSITKGIADFATGTVDAILNPSTIPAKLETTFDTVIVKPTLRTVDFMEKGTQKALADTDEFFNERVSKAQKGARHLKVVFAQPIQDIAMGSFNAKKYPKSEEDEIIIDDALKENFVFAHLTSFKVSRSESPLPFLANVTCLQQDVTQHEYVGSWPGFVLHQIIQFHRFTNKIMLNPPTPSFS